MGTGEREGREKGRDRAAAIGERQTGKMKQGEERRHGENSNENKKCVEGRGTEELSADSQNSNKNGHFKKENKKKNKKELAVTYLLLPRRQALSIPGDDIMVSIRWLEFGFWLLWSQKTIQYYDCCNDEKQGVWNIVKQSCSMKPAGYLLRFLWFSGVIKTILMQCCHLSGLLSLKSGLGWTKHKLATSMLCEFVMYSM